MQTAIRVDRDVPMEMRDGVRLRADIYRADRRTKQPAILMRTAYDKALCGGSDHLDPVQAAMAGYAVIVQDIRGRFASEGVWQRANMFAVEGADGYDSIEWIAAQPWCDGNVGMAGGSYLGGVQWLAAMESPPHLKAIAPAMADIAANMGPPLGSGATVFFAAADALPKTSLDLVEKMAGQGHDVAAVRRFIERAIADPGIVIHHLPLNDLPMFQLPEIRAMWEARLQVPSATEQARRRRYEQVLVPGFYLVGWFDQLEWATFYNFKQMRQRGGTALAREGQHILVGPWPHGPALGFMGEMEFPGTKVRGGYTPQTLAFFDKYLRGRDLDIPRVQHYLMGANQWRVAADWPLPGTDWQRYFLHSRGGANTAAGDGVLSREAPGAEPPDRFIYDPHHPVPTVGGRVVPAAGLVPGPFDQSAVERRADVLCYTTPPLDANLQVTGPIQVHLFAATSARDTDFTATLVVVYPGGKALNLAEGIQRARYREWGGDATLVTPGEVYTYTIQLGNTSFLFPRGSCIRIHISSSNFPHYDRNMNTGNAPGEDAVGMVAHQTVFHQAEYPSHIDLPIIAPGG